MGLLKRHSVTILNRKWETIIPTVKVKHIPRSGELLYFGDDIYYRVVNVVHYVLKKHGIFIIVEQLGTKPQDSANQ